MNASQHPVYRQPRWELDAACREHPTAWWFAKDEPEAIEAFLVCRDCRVRGQCLTFALDHPNLVGIWAGTTPRDRVRLRTQRRRDSRVVRRDQERP